MITNKALAELGASVLRQAMTLLATASLDLPGTQAANVQAAEAIATRHAAKPNRPKHYNKRKAHWTQTAAGRKRMSQIGRARHAAMRGNKRKVANIAI